MKQAHKDTLAQWKFITTVLPDDFSTLHPAKQEETISSLKLLYFSYARITTPIRQDCFLCEEYGHQPPASKMDCGLCLIAELHGQVGCVYVLNFDQEPVKFYNFLKEQL